MSEYLSEEEQVARMKSWWDENGMTVIVSVVVAVAAVLGWNWYGNYQQDQTAAASGAYVAYLEADASGKSAAADAVAERFPGSAYHVLVLFSQAQEALDAGELTAAETHLSAIVSVGEDNLLVDLARIRLAKLQQALDRSGEALATLSSISSEGYRTWGLEAKGDIHVSRGELQLAHEAYQGAIDSMPEGEQRPILEMKLHNAAPTEGEYVQFSDTLAQALEAAEETLNQAAAEVEAAAESGAAAAENEEVEETEESDDVSEQ